MKKSKYANNAKKTRSASTRNSGPVPSRGKYHTSMNKKLTEAPKKNHNS